MKRFAGILCILSAAFSSAAQAENFSFSGNFAQDNDKASFSFNVAAESTVSLLTYSYAGGVNAMGQIIARGGFDPILSLYNSSGQLITYNDDGAGSAPDSVTRAAYDTFLTTDLAAGSYNVFVTQFDNFGPNQLPGAFQQDANPNFRNGFYDATGDKRDGHWAFDILGVNSANMASSVPETGTWAMLMLGFGLIGFSLRRAKHARAEGQPGNIIAYG